MSRREQWEQIRKEGRARFLVRNGVLFRGIPMALVTILVIQAFEGDLGAELLTSTKFHGRLLFALVLFSLGGVASSYARWKSLEARFQDEP